MIEMIREGNFYTAVRHVGAYSTVLRLIRYVSGPCSRTDSLCNIGSVFGTLSASWTVRKLGRQKSLAVAVLPGLMGWAIIGMAYNTYILLIGR